MIRSRARTGAALLLWATAALPAFAQDCPMPDNIDWVFDQSCELPTGVYIAPRNITVETPAVVTMSGAATLIADLTQFSITVEAGARIDLAPNAAIRTNTIGPLLARRTDGGTFGYQLKEVGGPVLDAVNQTFPFYPASTVKIYHMAEALRQVDQGTLTLNSTLTSCPTTVIAGPAAAAATSCPAPFSNATANGGETNCAIPNVANNATTCGGSTVSYGLGVGLCAMMKISNNLATNAILDAVGGGDPIAGQTSIATGSGGAANLSGTTIASRLGCGNFDDPPPINLTTLRDLGRILEGMATDPDVLFPASQPAAVNFPATDAYNYMLNHVGSAIYNTVIQQEAADAGLSAATTNAFLALVRNAQKPGNSGDTFSGAGWVSLPINGGTATRDYVVGYFAVGVTTNGGNPTSGEMLPEILRPVIREALEAF